MCIVAACSIQVVAACNIQVVAACNIQVVAACNIQAIWNMYGVVKEISLFFTPKRQQELQEHIENLQLEPLVKQNS